MACAVKHFFNFYARNQKCRYSLPKKAMFRRSCRKDRMYTFRMRDMRTRANSKSRHFPPCTRILPYSRLRDPSGPSRRKAEYRNQQHFAQGGMLQPRKHISKALCRAGGETPAILPAFCYFNTAPVLALLTRRAYLASQPVVMFGSRGTKAAFLRASSSSLTSTLMLALGMSMQMVSPS